MSTEQLTLFFLLLSLKEKKKIGQTHPQHWGNHNLTVASPTKKASERLSFFPSFFSPSPRLFAALHRQSLGSERPSSASRRVWARQVPQTEKLWFSVKSSHKHLCQKIITPKIISLFSNKKSRNAGKILLKTNEQQQKKKKTPQLS